MNTLNPSKNLAARQAVGRFLSLFLLAGLLAGVYEVAGLAATNTPAAIPWNQIGAKAGANYQGDGLAVSPTAQGARLHCVFQRLDGEATPEGLWLTSTVTNTPSDRFRVTAMAVGRVTPCAPEASRTSNNQPSTSNIPLEDAGIISVAGQTVRLSRPGLVEEYSVSMDGVRQDFVVPARPAGAGELAVRLAVSGARVESTAAGARLVLDHSGRKLAYSRLRATDATGKELTARMQVESNFESSRQKAERSQSLLTSAATSSELADSSLVVVVNDAAAVYPVRIDPTFSDANWVSMSGDQGVNDYVGAMAVDGAGNVYIGGEFTTVNDIIVNGIARWDGSSWSALGSGIRGDYASVYALAVSGSNLYVGGYFTNADGIAATNIAKWDGSSWSALGSGISGESSDEYYGAGVFALAVSSGTLYAAGYFTSAGGIPANCIAQWDGSSWSALGSGMGGDYPAVNALAVSGSTLFVGGYFTAAGGIAANYIAQWDGSSWSALGSGILGGDEAGPFVSALAVSGGTLYAGGDFDYAGDVAASDLAQWDGSSWSALGSGISGQTPDGYGPYVNALAVLGGTLYVGGDFSTVDGVAANDLAQWDGSSWSALGWALNYEVSVLAVSGSTLYASGESNFGSGNAVASIAQWDGSSWSALDPGTGTFSGGDGQGIYLNALAVSGSTVYVGGDFSTAGGSPANFVAQWNGSSWSPLGLGMDYPVLALAVSGSTLFAGGYFMTAGGNPANAIAQWDGSSWSALGSGISGYDGPYDYYYYVDALAVSDGTLYAGGFFETADDYPANNIAQWDGNSWSPLGSGMDGVPYALAVSGGTLYAGGVFDTADGVPAANIAQWDGNNWSALGSGMEIGYGYYPEVNALALSGSTLYAGGYFTNAGGNAANNIAQWDGNNWSALGSGMSGAGYDGNGPYVNALAVSGGTLYAGGEFTGGRMATWPIASRNGTGAVGRPSARGFQVLAPMEAAPMCMRWRCREVTSMWRVISTWLAARSPN